MRNEVPPPDRDNPTTSTEETHVTSTTEADIPTLTTTEDAETMLRSLAETHDWVAVFWDRGWGNHSRTAEISIIADGNGQNPHAYLTVEVYRALRNRGVIGENTYGGHKARRLHDYKTPPAPAKTGPTSNDIAEQTIRTLMDTMADEPIRASFFRGVTGHPARRVTEEIATPAVGRYFVAFIPGHSDVAISAQEVGLLGPAIISGGGNADCLAYPRGADGWVDLEALAGDGFRAELEAAVRDKLAIINAHKQTTNA